MEAKDPSIRPVETRMKISNFQRVHIRFYDEVIMSEETKEEIRQKVT